MTRYVHIGLGKSGSTMLQRGVFPNFFGKYISSDEKLPYSLRWIYELNRTFDEELLLSPEKSTNSNTIRNIVNRIIAPNVPFNFENDFLLSSEGLVGCSICPMVNYRENAKVLKKLKFKRILIILRRHIDYIQSLYFQYIKDFRIDPELKFIDFYGGYDAIVNDSFLQMSPIIQEYYKLFGMNNVIVLPFEKINDTSYFLDKIDYFLEGKINISKCNVGVIRKGNYSSLDISPSKVLIEDSLRLFDLTGEESFNSWYQR